MWFLWQVQSAQCERCNVVEQGGRGSGRQGSGKVRQGRDKARQGGKARQGQKGGWARRYGASEVRVEVRRVKE